MWMVDLIFRAYSFYFLNMSYNLYKIKQALSLSKPELIFLDRLQKKKLFSRDHADYSLPTFLELNKHALRKIVWRSMLHA